MADLRRTIGEFVLGTLTRLRRGRSGSALLWYGGSSIVAQALRLVTYFLGLKLLDRSDYADWGRFQLLLGFSCFACELGQGVALYSAKSKKPEYPSFNLLMNLGGVLTSIPLSYGLAKWFDWSDSRVAEIWWLVPIIALISAFAVPSRIIAEKAFRFKYLAFVNITTLVANLTVLLLLSGVLQDFRLLAAASVAEMGILVVLLIRWLPLKSLPTCVTPETKKYYLREYLPLLSPRLLFDKLATLTDTFVLDRFSSTSQLGLYARTVDLVRIPMSASINLMDKPLLALASSNQDDPAALRKLLLLLLIVIPTMALTACVGVIIFIIYFSAHPAILGPEKAAEFKPILPFIIAPALMQPIGAGINLLITGAGRPHLLFWFSLSFFVSKATAAIILVKGYDGGAAGMLTAVAIGWILPIVLTLALLWKDLKYSAVSNDEGTA